MKTTNDEKTSLKDSFKNKKFLFLYIIILFLFLLLATAFIQQLLTYHTTKSYENHILQIANLNKETVFSLDDIFIFSSSTATNNTRKQSFMELRYSSI